MSDEAQTNEETELQILKQRADTLGVQYSNNIGLNTLRERVNAAMEGEQSPEEDEDENAVDEQEEEEPADIPEPKEEPVNPLAAGDAPDFSKIKDKAKRTMAIRAHQRKESLKLVRVRISNLNPAKKDMPGEILTTGNKYIGTVKRYIPFGEATDDGWHVEQCLLDMMKERKFLQIRHIRDRRTGINRTETRYVREFAIDVLPPLTQEDLDRLARTQAVADNT
jgi:hypothetical protein